MKIRFLLVAASVLGLVSSAAATPARGDDLEADVGGGAAGVVASLELQSFDLAPLFQDNDRVNYTVSQPRVAMGKNGGSQSFRVLSKTFAGVSIKAVELTVTGNRHGTPYAQASTTLEDVRIPHGALAGTALGTFSVFCRWDTTGAVGHTTIIDVNGNKVEPAVGEAHDLPGIGTLTFNEQYTDTIYLRDANGNYVLGPNGDFLYSETLYVIGAHIHAEEPLVLVDGSTTQDIYLGFTSCDPLKLPPLSGLSLSQTST